MAYVDLLEISCAHALTDANILRVAEYAARCALRELDGSENLSNDDHKRIPLIRAEIYQHKGDGNAMVIAAQSGFYNWVSQNPERPKRWLRSAVKSAKKAAIRVFRAQSFAGKPEAYPECVPTIERYHELVSDLPRRQRGEGAHYRAGRRKRFYVYDPVLTDPGSSIENIRVPKKRAVSGTKAFVFDTLRKLDAYFGGGGYVASMTDRLTDLVKQGRGAEAIEICYQLRADYTL